MIVNSSDLNRDRMCSSSPVYRAPFTSAVRLYLGSSELMIQVSVPQGERIQFAWPSFGCMGATEVASVRSCQKLPLCPMEPVPAGSKMDSLLAKAEPTTVGGRAPGIT